jgi:hypothetical protein
VGSSAVGFRAEHVPAYLGDLIAADLASAGSGNVVAKLKSDFDKQGIHVSVEGLASRIIEFETEARRQLTRENA